MDYVTQSVSYQTPYLTQFSCPGNVATVPVTRRLTTILCVVFQEGYGNTALGCVSCNCSSVGASSLTCDPVTGQCPCKPGAGGFTCTQCQPGYYDFTEEGCASMSSTLLSQYRPNHKK